MFLFTAVINCQKCGDLKQHKFLSYSSRYQKLKAGLAAVAAAAAKSLQSCPTDSLRPHRWQPTRLPRPWDSPGKNTGVGCHFLLQCMKVKSESEVAQSCLTLSNPMDRSLPGSSVLGIFQARVLEWGTIAFSKAGLKELQLSVFGVVCCRHWGKTCSLPFAGTRGCLHSLAIRQLGPLHLSSNLL